MSAPQEKRIPQNILSGGFLLIFTLILCLISGREFRSMHADDVLYPSADLHEAAPEYPVINAIVFHENSAELAAMALLELQLEGLEFRLEASPPLLRGLSHREWGDTTPARSILLETANASQGRLKGRSSPSLIIEGKDKNYSKASNLGLLFVPWDENGIPLKVRVGRHLAAIQALISGLRDLEPDKEIRIKNIPSASAVKKSGISAFLSPPKQP